MRRFVVWIAPLVLLAMPVRAQDPRADRARAQYLKGQAAYDRGDYGAALQRFEAAYAEKPVAALLFNVAQCHRKLGQLTEAAKDYRAFLAADPDSPHAEQTRALLAQVEADLRARSAVLDPPGPPGSAPVNDPARVAPVAAHALALPSAGSRTAPAAAVANGAVPVVRGRTRWPSMAAAGTAAALFAGGLVEALASRSTANELDRLHQQGAVDPAVDRQMRDDANAKASRSKLLYVASGVAAVAGVGLWFAF